MSRRPIPGCAWVNQMKQQNQAGLMMMNLCVAKE
jgi:hypothetical protein